MKSFARLWLRNELILSEMLIILSLFSGNVFANDPPVTALTFSSDGQFVFAAQDNRVRKYQFPELKLQETFEVPFSKIHDIQISPDEKLLAIAGGDPGEAGVVQIIDQTDKKVRFVRTLHSDSVYKFTWLQDSHRFVTVAIDGGVRLDSIHLMEPLREFHGHSKGVVAAGLLDDDQFLITAGLDQSLRVWNIESGENIRTLNNHTAAINDLAVRKQDEGLPVVVSVASDHTVRFWQPTIGRMVRFVKLEAIPLAVAWHPSKLHVVVTTSTGQVIVIDYQTATILQQIETDRAWLHAIAISPDEKFVVIQSEEGIQKVALDFSKLDS